MTDPDLSAILSAEEVTYVNADEIGLLAESHEALRADRDHRIDGLADMARRLANAEDTAEFWRKAVLRVSTQAEQKTADVKRRLIALESLCDALVADSNNPSQNDLLALGRFISAYLAR